MTDSNKLASYTAGLKADLNRAEKKAELFESQYEKYRKQAPDVASCHKLQMGFEYDKVRLLKGQIKKAEELLRRFASLKVKRKK